MVNDFRAAVENVHIITEHLDLLNEKLVIAGRGQKYGQIMFLAGGGGSGKGFAIKNFIDSSSYRVVDVDKWKLLYLAHHKKTGKNPELSNMDLRNPEHTGKLHTFVKNKGTKDKELHGLVTTGDQKRNPETLPNILFDMTGKDLKDYTGTIPRLLEAGYKPENIHLCWVFAPYDEAVADNRKRKRVVDDAILFDAHSNIPKVIMGMISHGMPEGMNGDFFVINAARKATVLHAKTPDSVRGMYGDEDGRGKQSVIKDFSYLRIKTAGKPLQPAKSVLEQLKQMVRDNAPRTSEVWKSTK